MSTPNMELRRINRNRIFRFILQHGSTSKAEISHELRLSLPTVTQNIASLKEQNLVVEGGEYESTGGRRAKMIVCNAGAQVAVGIDITRSHISAVLVDLLGNTLDSVREEYDCLGAIERTPVWMGQLIERMLRTNEIPDERVLGVGVSLPAILRGDCQHIDTAAAPVLPIPDDFYERLRPHIRFPYLFYNDANCGGFAELWSRRPIDRDMFYLSLSATVGGAAIIDGKIYVGGSFAGGEVGHTTLVPGGKPCYCGQRGCVGSYCNCNCLAELTGGSLPEFFARLQQGDPAVCARLDEYLDYLAIAIHNVRMLFDCDIILGGYVGSYSDLFLDQLRLRLRRLDTFDRKTDYVVGCHHHTEAAAVGAALIYVSRFIDRV